MSEANAAIDGVGMTVIVSIMLVMGVLGGSVNHAMRSRDPTEVETSLARWGKAVLIGCGASLLIPLFLNTISSSLLADAMKERLGPKSLIFAGFCLIAAISSRAFITTLSQKILEEVREAKDQAVQGRQVAEQAQQKADAIADAVAEPGAQDIADASPAASQPSGAAPGEVAASKPVPIVSLTPVEEAYLESFWNSKYSLRSTWGVAQDMKKSPEDAKDDLIELMARGLVDRVEGKKGPRWLLTATGKMALNHV